MMNRKTHGDRQGRILSEFLCLVFALVLTSCGNPLGDSSSQEGSSDFCPHNRDENGDCIEANPDFDSNWDFNDFGDYTFNSNNISLSGGVASLRALDLTLDTEIQWEAGTFIGSTESTGKLFLNSSKNNSLLEESWTPQWSNLESYWRMEESSWSGAAGEVSDSKGSVNGQSFGDAAISGSSKIQDGAGSFDGTGDYVDIGSSINFDGSQSFSVNLWFKTLVADDGSTGDNFIAGTDSSTGFYLKLEGGAPAGRPAVGIGDGVDGTEALGSEEGFHDNNWHMMTLVWDAPANTIYGFIDGNLFASSIQANIDSLDDSLAIAEVSGAFYNGRVDDMAVWSAALSAEEVFKIYSHQSARFSGSYKSEIFDFEQSAPWPSLSFKSPIPYNKELPGSMGNEDSDDYSELVDSTGTAGDSDLSDSLLALWHLNGSIGVIADSTIYTDDSSNSFDLSANDADGSNTISHVYAPFKEGIRFDGANDYLSVNGSFLSSTMSVSGWIRPTTATSGRWLSSIRFSGTDDDGIQLSADTTTIDVSISTNSFADVALNCSSAGPNWQHVVLTFTTTDSKLYLNGEECDSATGGNNVFDLQPADLNIGRDNLGADTYFQGDLDEIAMWSRSLSEEEVLEIFRRSANRVKFQVRSCSNSDCGDQEALTGDGWIGAKGDHESFFSEIHNNTSIDINGNPDGAIHLLFPYFEFADFPSSPVNNRYFQFRSFLESHDQSFACSGGVAPCFPSVNNVSLNSREGGVASGDVIPRYKGSSSVISNSEAQLFTVLKSITISESGDCSGISYRFSNDDGSTWLYYNSGWTSSSSTSQSSSKTDIEENITTLPVGSGLLKFQVVLPSDTSTSCAISHINLVGVE